MASYTTRVPLNHTCRCTCTAYSGHCDCWFDGNLKGASDVTAALEQNFNAGYEQCWREVASELDDETRTRLEGLFGKAGPP